jgi:hypothetical protein
VITALSSMEYAYTRYPATWAAWTLLILFSEMFKLIKKIFFNKKSVMENIWMLKNILFSEMKISKFQNK